MNTVDELSITEVTTLSHLYQSGALFPSEMADIVKIKAQSMSQILNRMENLNLIVKTPSVSDKRKISISLSAFGKEKVEQTREERDEWLSGAIEHQLSASEKKLLQEAIVLMDKIAEYKQ